MGQARSPTIEDMPMGLLAEPLEWFFAEHFRHRQFCGLVDEVANAVVFDGARIARIVDFLRYDLSLHIIDEEEDLFPLLRRRCLPGDQLEQVLGVLSAEHRNDAAVAARVRSHLEACLDTQTAPGLDLERRKAMRAFAAQERQHLGLENAIVLPIARLRLSRADLDALGRRLAARRGLDLTAASK